MTIKRFACLALCLVTCPGDLTTFEFLLSWRDRAATPGLRRPHFAALCYLLGAWWIGVGVGIYFVFGKPDNLVPDSLKGTLLMLLVWRCQGGRMPLRRH